jgi:para-nitrobenzyl esterase
MMAKHYKEIFICSLIHIYFYINVCHAQCGSRYLDTSFTHVDSFTNIVYTTSAGGNTTETMDIYQPSGDTACLRHLIIWAHGGAFFQGSKNDADMEFFCRRFAQRGYVCASINYRLASSIVLLYDSTQIFKYAYEAVSDFKAAIRYFYKSAASGNHWNIDTNAIFIAGSSAGAIAADFIASLDSLSQLSTPFQTEVTNQGGIDGNSGNAGYSQRINAVGSLAGAVVSTSWITSRTPPTVFCQGTADGTVPYDCGLALTQYTGGLYPTINFCGSGAMKPAMDSVHVMNSLLPFPGSGHVPWDTNVVIENRTDSAVAAFFYQVNCVQAPGHCSEPLGISPAEAQAKIQIYPNPAHDRVQIAIEESQFDQILIYDLMGREILHPTITEGQNSFTVSGLAPGIYSLQLYLKNNNSAPLVRKLLIE